MIQIIYHDALLLLYTCPSRMKGKNFIYMVNKTFSDDTLVKC